MGSAPSLFDVARNRERPYDDDTLDRLKKAIKRSKFADAKPPRTRAHEIATLVTEPHPDHDNLTVLHEATHWDRHVGAPVVSYLLNLLRDAGVSVRKEVNRKDLTNERTAFHDACRYIADGKVIEGFLDLGARPTGRSAEDAHGVTPKAYATRVGNSAGLAAIAAWERDHDGGAGEEKRSDADAQLADAPAARPARTVTGAAAAARAGASHLEVENADAGTQGEEQSATEAQAMRRLPYTMKQKMRGHCLLINIREDRPGTDHDAKGLKEVMTRLRFKVIDVDNPHAVDIETVIENERKNEELKEHDAFVCIVLSHGNDDGAGNHLIKAGDGETVNVQTQIIDKFLPGDNGCPYLENKPKIFIINACRTMGSRYKAALLQLANGFQGCYNTVTDSELSLPIWRASKADSEPAPADVIKLFSTRRGFVSYRDRTEGSFFIQELIKELNAAAKMAEDGKIPPSMQDIAEAVVASTQKLSITVETIGGVTSHVHQTASWLPELRHPLRFDPEWLRPARLPWSHVTVLDKKGEEVTGGLKPPLKPVAFGSSKRVFQGRYNGDPVALLVPLPGMRIGEKELQVMAKLQQSGRFVHVFGTCIAPSPDDDEDGDGDEDTAAAGASAGAGALGGGGADRAKAATKPTVQLVVTRWAEGGDLDTWLRGDERRKPPESGATGAADAGESKSKAAGTAEGATASDAGATGHRSPPRPKPLVVVRIAQQVAEALLVMSELGLVHGDVAARNVLLKNKLGNGHDASLVGIMLCDFGLSRTVDPINNDYRKAANSERLPQKLLAPELIKPADGFLRFSKKTDMWSFGVLLWELFFEANEAYRTDSAATASGGHAGGDDDDVQFARFTKFVKNDKLSEGGTPQTTPPSCHEDMWKIAKKCLKLEARERCDMQEVLDDLNALEGTLKLRDGDE